MFLMEIWNECSSLIFKYISNYCNNNSSIFRNQLKLLILSCPRKHVFTGTLSIYSFVANLRIQILFVTIIMTLQAKFKLRPNQNGAQIMID